jgi:hypothetical protein
MGLMTVVEEMGLQLSAAARISSGQSMASDPTALGVAKRRMSSDDSELFIAQRRS